jgi:hypothetical protein
MTDPAVLTGIAAILTALGTLIGLVINLMQSMKKNTATTNATQTLVNNSHDEQANRLDQLTQALTDSGTTIPVDPAIAAGQERITTHKEGNV